MLTINFNLPEKPKILCLGAHPDDIEIGCGGTLLRLIEEIPDSDFYWVVFSGNKQRQKEANASAECLLKGLSKRIIIGNFRESYFPYIGASIKDDFELLKKELSPDLIFTHYQKDAHQDHRLISELTWNTFRNHLILEYEVPKYEGDLRTPNLYVHLNESQASLKINHILQFFKSQTEKNWFTADSFKALLRVRGIECNSRGQYAEGFHCHKLVF
ncbi:MAG: PIG-L family deacetylase [Candidatus Bathyarchaeota archaeon]|nr:PIG-L family deacetylase [Candidatus Bathyarchaeota archaeon]